MKFAAAFLLLIVYSTAFSQDVTLVGNSMQDPADLYKKANESLNTGNTKLAINIFEQVIAFYQREGRVKELSENYLGMALAFALNGNYTESILYHKKALKAHRKY